MIRLTNSLFRKENQMKTNHEITSVLLLSAQAHFL